jgi:putative DNA-invertase from lambdoid prophage Rac
LILSAVSALCVDEKDQDVARAKAEGKVLGHSSALSADQQLDVNEKIENGEAISAIAREFRTSRQTIMRVSDHT